MSDTIAKTGKKTGRTPRPDIRREKVQCRVSKETYRVICAFQDQEGMGRAIDRMAKMLTDLSPTVAASVTS